MFQTLERSATKDEFDLQLSRLENYQIGRNWLPVEIAQNAEATTHLVGSVLLQQEWV